MSSFKTDHLAPSLPHRLDHSLYAHSAFNGRAPWRPKGPDTRVALIIYLYVECFEAAPPAGAVFDQRYRSGLASKAPYLRANAQFEYGNRIGIFRILDVLDELGLTPCVPINAAACDAYPALIDMLNERGVEFIGHGEYTSQMVSSNMDIVSEADLIRRSLDKIEIHTGSRPNGWLSQDYGQSQNTVGLLDKAGIKYICDYSNDEHPYVLNTPCNMVSVPNCAEWNDVEMMVHRKLSARTYARAVTDAFDCLWEDGAGNTRVCAVHLHPWISGQPSRFAAVAAMLREIAARDGVWRAQPSHVAAACAF